MQRQSDDERQWRAQSALETLARAEEHKRDPGLMRDVKRIARERQKSLNRVIGAGGSRPATGKSPAPRPPSTGSKRKK